MFFGKKAFYHARNIIKNSNIIKNTPLELNERLSVKYNANIYFKREDVQTVRSFKVRGAYYKIFKNYSNEKNISITTCSAGNHAQGVATTCNTLKLNHTIYVPTSTPKQKIDRIKHFGGKYLNLQVFGDSFQECMDKSLYDSDINNTLFVHPFNDYDVMLGQSTVAQEIYDELTPDYIFSCVGGGGLISGVGSYSRYKNSSCKVIGVEPNNANSLELSLNHKAITSVENVDTFVDGAAVKEVGDKCFSICNSVVDKVVSVNNGKLCKDIIDTYQNDGIILEPAGTLSISGLDHFKNDIVGQNVVCILTGSNNDLTRYPDMIEKAAIYNKTKHYFLIEFKQVPGQLIKFTDDILVDNIDITRFEYLKKTNRDTGTVMVGIELDFPEQIDIVIENMKKHKYKFKKVDENNLLFDYLI